MALPKKIYGVERLKSAPFSGVHGVHGATIKIPKPLVPQSELRRLGTLELKLELVRNQGDKLRIGGLALGVGHCVAEEPLEGIQITTIPGHFDGMANGPLHSAWRCSEILGYLRIENLRDGVACLTARWWATKACCVPFGFIAFFIVPYLTTLRV